MVNVCGICGNPGYTDLLVICNGCSEVAEHVYCMHTLSEIDPGICWLCEECTAKCKAPERKISLALSYPQGAQPPSSNPVPRKQSNIEKLNIANSGQSYQISGKRQRDNVSCPQVKKKQVIESSNVVTNLCQRDNSLLGSEAGNDDIHVGSQQICVSDGPFKAPRAGKIESGSIKSLQTFSDSAVPSLLRENSFKKVEMPKVKLTPPTTSLNLSRGSHSRGTSTPAGSDRDSGAVNKLGPQSSSPMAPLAPASLPSGSKSAVLTKFGNSSPSFLAPPRQTISARGQVASGSSRVVDGGYRQSSLAAELSGLTAEGKFRGSSSSVYAHISSIPVSKPQNDVAQAIPRVNIDVKSMGGPPGNSSTGNLTILKSDTGPTSMPLISESCRPDEALASSKGNLGVTLTTAELEFSAVMGEDSNRLESTAGKMKVSEVPRRSPERLLLAEDLKESALAPSLKTDKGGSKCLGLIKEDIEGHGLGKDPKCLSAIEVDKDDCRHLVLPNEHSVGLLSTGEDHTVLSLVKANMITDTTSKKCVESLTCPKDDGLVLSKESNLLQLHEKEPKDLISSNDGSQESMLVLKDSKIAASTKVVSPVIVEEQSNMRNIDKVTEMPVCQNVTPPSTECLPDTTVSSLDELNSGQINGTWTNESIDGTTDVAFQTSSSTINKRAWESNNSIEPESLPQVIRSGRQDTSSGALNDGTQKTPNEIAKMIYNTGDVLAKAALPIPAPKTFGRHRLVAAPIGRLRKKPSEINLAMEKQTSNPWGGVTMSEKFSSSMNIGAQTSPQCTTFGFPQQKAPTLPTSQLLWKGVFEVIDKACGYRVYDGIQAHPSNKASLKVYEVSKKFLSHLRMEQVQRADAWPKRFRELPPTDGDIALYFFPGENERWKRSYDKLLKDTIEYDLAMRAYLDNAELLIFSSVQLPECYHRFNGCLYLWGVFRGNQKASPVHNLQGSFTHSNHGGANVLRSDFSVPLSSSSIEDVITRELPNMHENEGGEEDMDVDMVGGIEVGISKRPVPRTDSQLAGVSTKHTSELSVPLNSQTSCIPQSSILLSQQEDAKSGEHVLFEQDWSASVSSRIKSERTLEKIKEQVSRTTMKSIDRSHIQACQGGISKELQLTSGLEPSHQFCHLKALHRKSSRKLPEVVHGKRNMYGERLPEREFTIQSGSAKVNQVSEEENFLPGPELQDQNPQPGGLQIQNFPPGFVSACGKPAVPFVDHPLEKQRSKHFQAGLHSKSESQKEINPRVRQLACSSRQENSSRDCVERPHNSRQSSLSSGQSDYSYGSRWRSLSPPFTPANRQIDRNRDTPKLNKSHLGENNCCIRREKVDERERREHTNRGNERDTERRRHGQRHRYPGIRVTQMKHQRKGHDRGTKRGVSSSHSHSRSSSYSHSCSQLPTRSCSPSRAVNKYLDECNSESCHLVNSSDSYSADGRFSLKRLSQKRDSACGVQLHTRNCLEEDEAPMDNDFRLEKSDAKIIIEPEISLLEVEEGCSIIRSREASAGQEQMTKDQWSFTPLHNLIDEAAENRNVSEVSNAGSLDSSEQMCSGENVPRELMEADLPGRLDSRTNFTSRSRQVEWTPMGKQGTWWCGSSSRPADIKPVTCLELFPLEEENLGVVRSVVNDSDINLDLGLGRQNSKKGLLPVCEQALARCYSNSIADAGDCPVKSMQDCHNSSEGSPNTSPLLSLSLHFVKEGGQSLD